MATPMEFEERYKKGDLPWDSGMHDGNLKEVIHDYSIDPCPVLELGAGTCSDAIWLARQGFKVTAIDVSPTAVEMAKKKISEAGVNIEVICVDVLMDKFHGNRFALIFDRGCFHSLETVENKSQLVRIIYDYLEDDGYWFSIIGSTDGPEREHGPPRMSLLDIAELVEPQFEFIRIKAIEMDTNLPEPPRGWACLMRKRRVANP
jgi:SAM-dependent methyltransferase